MIRPLRLFLKFSDPTLRTTNGTATDVTNLVTNKAYPGERAFLVLGTKAENFPNRRSKNKQQLLWEKSMQSMGFGEQNTAFQSVPM